MLDLDGLEFRYEPFPIGVVRPVIQEDLYKTLVSDYPPMELFKHTPGTGHKYSLSEKNNPREYHDFVKSRPHWRELHRFVKSRDFIASVMETLARQHIDIGLPCAVAPRRIILARTLAALVQGHAPHNVERLRSRFEFSALPADGGFVRPHTDTPKKRITLIVSIAEEGEWRAEYGGGTDVNRPRSSHHAYNWRNDSIEFEDVEVLDTYGFQPNQCVLFVKTFNSLHSVRPMTGAGSEAMRRTLTINLEIEH